MCKLRTLSYFFAGPLACLLLLADAPAQNWNKQAPEQPNEIIQGFPTNDLPKTAGRFVGRTQTVMVDTFRVRGSRRVRKKPGWSSGHVRLAEMFVPHASSGSPRFWDVSYDFDRW